MHAETLDFWQAVGYSLPFDSATPDLDEFNRDIQRDVEYWEHRKPDLALHLAQLKLEVNRRFHRASHAK